MSSSAGPHGPEVCDVNLRAVVLADAVNVQDLHFQPMFEFENPVPSNVNTADCPAAVAGAA